jgi:epoxyqueuosine reductase
MNAADVAAMARRHGFHRAAVVPVVPSERAGAYQAWLDAGYHGEMTYLATPEHVAPRRDLRALEPEVRTLVVVALVHDRVDPPAPDGLVALRGRIARYARGDDYHMVLRDRLHALADELAATLGASTLARACFDAAPVLERNWAERAGLGFVAKNTMLIAPGLGSYVMLGELLLGVELDGAAPAPVPPRCGGCRACLDACPTGAFVEAYLLDARRCISYLTIEHRGVIARELRPLMGTWIFGCDVCQQVCPFNAGGAPAPDPRLTPRDLDHALPDLVMLATCGTNQLRRFVQRTALRRAPRPQLLRNVAIALGNTGDARAVPAATALLGDRAALIRAHAVWALRQLARALPAHAAAIDASLRARAQLESDADVLAELDAT